MLVMSAVSGGVHADPAPAQCSRAGRLQTEGGPVAIVDGGGGVLVAIFDGG